MHVGVIIDEERLDHEGAMLRRLARALVDCEDTVSLFVPAVPARSEPLPALEGVAVIEYPARVPPWLRAARTRQLAAATERSPPEVLYAVGTEAWSVGLQLATAIGRPLALDVWTADQMRTMPRRRFDRHVAAYVAPTEGLGRGLAERVDPALVSVVPPGIEPPGPPDPRSSAKAPSVVVIGSGRDLAAYVAVLTALGRVAPDVPLLQAAIELRGVRGHDVWREARRLEVLGLLAAIREAEPLRHVVTSCSVLVIPDRLGEMRSLILEAMAHGMAVLASDDPYLQGMLVPGRTALLAADSDAELWAGLLRRVLLDGEEARRLGEGAKAMVAARHRVDHHASALHETLERALRGEALPFRGGRERRGGTGGAGP